MITSQQSAGSVWPKDIVPSVLSLDMAPYLLVKNEGSGAKGRVKEQETLAQ